MAILRPVTRSVLSSVISNVIRSDGVPSGPLDAYLSGDLTWYSDGDGTGGTDPFGGLRPAISGITGTVTHGSQITISGTKFGSRNFTASRYVDNTDYIKGDGVAVADYSAVASDDVVPSGVSWQTSNSGVKVQRSNLRHPRITAQYRGDNNLTRSFVSYPLSLGGSSGYTNATGGFGLESLPVRMSWWYKNDYRGELLYTSATASPATGFIKDEIVTIAGYSGSAVYRFAVVDDDGMFNLYSDIEDNAISSLQGALVTGQTSGATATLDQANFYYHGSYPLQGKVLRMWYDSLGNGPILSLWVNAIDSAGVRGTGGYSPSQGSGPQQDEWVHNELVFSYDHKKWFWYLNGALTAVADMQFVPPSEYQNGKSHVPAVLGWDYAREGGQGVTFSEVNFDHDIKHVVLADSENLATATHIETQEIVTYADTSTQIILNQGSFPSLTGLYLHIVGDILEDGTKLSGSIQL